MIAMWSGAIVDIPTGYHLCDGTAGTPDLRDKFVVGAGTTYNPADTGGSNTQVHGLPANTGGMVQSPELVAADAIAVAPADHSHTLGGNTDSADNRPPYYSLAYIQRIA